MKFVINTVAWMLLCLSVPAYDGKEALGIEGVNLEAFNVGELLGEPVCIESDYGRSSAITYILYGSAKSGLECAEARMITYTDQTVSQRIIDQSKPFLLDVAINHTNQTTRAMASITLGFAFPNDQQVSCWLYDTYFFKNIPSDCRQNILRTISVGKFNCPKTDQVVKAGLMSSCSAEVINAAFCIMENSSYYPDIFSELMTSLLTLRERHQCCPNFESSASINVAYRSIAKALERYMEKCSRYLEQIREVAAHIKNKDIRMLILEIERHNRKSAGAQDVHK